jgi:hypothetical protein
LLYRQGDKANRSNTALHRLALFGRNREMTAKQDVICLTVAIMSGSTNLSVMALIDQ